MAWRDSMVIRVPDSPTAQELKLYELINRDRVPDTPAENENDRLLAVERRTALLKRRDNDLFKSTDSPRSSQRKANGELGKTLLAQKLDEVEEMRARENELSEQTRRAHGDVESNNARNARMASFRPTSLATTDNKKRDDPGTAQTPTTPATAPSSSGLPPVVGLQSSSRRLSFLRRKTSSQSMKDDNNAPPPQRSRRFSFRRTPSKHGNDMTVENESPPPSLPRTWSRRLSFRRNNSKEQQSDGGGGGSSSLLRMLSGVFNGTSQSAAA